MSPTHVDDASLSLLYHKYLRYVDVLKALYHKIPIDFEYSRNNSNIYQSFRVQSKSLLEYTYISSIIELMKVRC